MIYNTVPAQLAKSKILELSNQFVIVNDRLKYQGAYEAIEAFSAANGLIIGGINGIMLSLGYEFARDNGVYDLYFGGHNINSFEVAKALANRIQDNTDGLVYVDTKLKHRIFFIFISTRLVCRLYFIGEYKGINTIDLLGAISIQGWFIDDEIKCIGPDIQMIFLANHIYSLYSQFLESYDKAELYDMWSKLYELAGHKHVKSLIGATGGNKGPNFNHKIIEEIIKPNGYIIVGDLASKDTGRLQFLMDGQIEGLIEAIKRLIGGPIVAQEFDLKLPVDKYLIKWTIYKKELNGQDMCPIADVYNSLEYSLIPYMADKGHAWAEGAKVGTPFVLFKFKIIEIYALNIIKKLKGNKGLDRRIAEAISDIDGLISTIRANGGHEAPDGYSGVYIEDNILQKKALKESKEAKGEAQFFKKYFPSMEKNN
jgi:hypothetical protein